MMSGLLSPSPAPGAGGGDVAIVVGPETPVDNLSLSEIRKLFLGDRQFWAGTQRVTLLIRAPVARERDVVLKKIYQMTEAQYRQYWISKIFSCRSEHRAQDRFFQYDGERSGSVDSGSCGLC
jgi:hypothetical protein